MIDIDERDGAACFSLHVRPASRRDAIVGEHDRALKIAVRAAPEQGKANKAVLQLLAAVLGCPKQDLAILRGATHSRKTIAVARMSPVEVADRLRKILASPGMPADG